MSVSDKVPSRLEMKVFVKLVVVALVLAAAAVVFAIGAIVTNLVLDGRAGRAFARVQMNASTRDVEALLGKPDVVRPCSNNLWWGGDDDYRGPNDGRRVTEVRYEYFLSAWGIGYSSAGRVVSKYHYFSE